MTSLRARQKAARKTQMLEAARALFLANGYGKTSIEAIAEAAEVGVATVYTYFETKEGLAAAIIQKDVGQTIEEADELVKSLLHDPMESIISIVGIFADFKKYISAELLKEFVIQAKQDGPIHEQMAWAHECQVTSIEKVIRLGQNAERVSMSLNARLAAELIIDLLDRHISRATSASDASKYAGKLDAYLRLLFEYWASKTS